MRTSLFSASIPLNWVRLSTRWDSSGPRAAAVPTTTSRFAMRSAIS